MNNIQFALVFCQQMASLKSCSFSKENHETSHRKNQHKTSHMAKENKQQQKSAQNYHKCCTKIFENKQKALFSC
jgi:hypothetical protein